MQNHHHKYTSIIEKKRENLYFLLIPFLFQKIDKNYFSHNGICYTVGKKGKKGVVQLAIFQNVPLILALFSILFAQFIKVPIHFLLEKQINWSLLTSTGGMPSSHSAAVTSLATAVGFETGFDSPIFAVAAMFAIIVMYDASGVRYQAGQHAAILNKIRQELSAFFRDIKHWTEKNEYEKHEELKTLLGHKPNEVLSGALTGILISVIFYTFIQ